MGRVRRAALAVATFPLYVLGGLAFLAVFIAVMMGLWLVGREVADAFGLTRDGSMRTVVEYVVPGGLALLATEKIFGTAADALERWRERRKKR